MLNAAKWYSTFCLMLVAPLKSPPPRTKGPKGIFVPMDLYDLHQPLASVIHHGKIAAEAGNP